MKNLIRQILKEEVEQVVLSEILTKLEKIYPKLDYCVSEDGNKLKIWTYYMSSFEDMGADPDQPEEFTESGVWLEVNDSGSLNVGTFNDFRDNDGTYYDSDIGFSQDVTSFSTEPTSLLKHIVKILDYEFEIEYSGGNNYEGRPKGDPSHAFDWRKC